MIQMDCKPHEGIHALFEFFVFRPANSLASPRDLGLCE